jgi:antitoxin (DNA-binding transcriptional repressor) of toxin-antitoxin stability system
MLIKMHQAKTRLSELVERALAGEDVIIARGEQSVVRLVPAGAPGHPQPGSMADELAPMAAERVAPWSDAELEALGFTAFAVPAGGRRG